MKYTHRITVPAWISFDLQSDNIEPTMDEVFETIGDYIEGHEIDRDLHAWAYVQCAEKEYAIPSFEIEDTEENENEDNGGAA